MLAQGFFYSAACLLWEKNRQNFVRSTVSTMGEISHHHALITEQTPAIETGYFFSLLV